MRGGPMTALAATLPSYRDPRRYDTRIASPRCSDRLLSHNSTIEVSTGDVGWTLEDSNSSFAPPKASQPKFEDGTCFSAQWWA